MEFRSVCSDKKQYAVYYAGCPKNTADKIKPQRISKILNYFNAILYKFKLDVKIKNTQNYNTNNNTFKFQKTVEKNSFGTILFQILSYTKVE